METFLPDFESSNSSFGIGVTKKDLQFDCPNCEYYVELKMENGIAGAKAFLVDHPEVVVTTIVGETSSLEEERKWLSLNSPSDPYKVFSDSSYRLKDILDEIAAGNTEILFGSEELVRRMTFAAVISGMEAYLGDRLVNAVFSDERVLRKLLASEMELQKIAVKLADVLGNPGIVSSKTREYLATILYHNLPKVGVLYKIALGIDFFPDEQLKTRLMKAVALRHDIVHRNGKTTAGEILEFPRELVEAVLDDVCNLVAHVEEQTKLALIALATKEPSSSN